MRVWAFAFLAGLGVTGLVQSSNATAVIVSSFVGQGLIAVAPALAIMLGANVGTALMVQVFSLDLSWLSPLLIFVGVIGHLTWKGSKPGHVGRVLIGLGLIILALELISTATRPVVQAAGVLPAHGRDDPEQNLPLCAHASPRLRSPRGRCGSWGKTAGPPAASRTLTQTYAEAKRADRPRARRP